MNKAVISGRLTRDAVVRYSQGNDPTAVARFTLAVDRKVKRDQNTQSADFISCVAFGKQGEFMEKFEPYQRQCLFHENQSFCS